MKDSDTPPPIAKDPPAADQPPAHTPAAPRPPIDNDPAPANEPAVQPEPAVAPKPSTSLDRELAETKDRLLRTLADMDNMRKRTEREVAGARIYGISNFARDILGVADNMHRAMAALDEELRAKADEPTKVLLEGVELTEREL